MGLISRVSSRTYRDKMDINQANALLQKTIQQQKLQAHQQAAAIQQQYFEQQKEQQKIQRQQQMQQKYQQLLKTIDELGKDIRPTYAGSRGAPERLKKGIVTAKNLVRECLIETERAARAQD